MTFTETELAYLAGQRLGRLATRAPDGTLQNNPVGFTVEADGSVEIGGFRMGATRKYANVAADPEVAFVVDDLASTSPWKVRGVEIRGRAEAVDGVPREPGSYLSAEVIRIRPRRILTWGLDGDGDTLRARTV